MGSTESLNKRIRETVSNLSDEELANMVRATTHRITPFARRVAKEELSRRLRMKCVVQVRDGGPAAISIESIDKQPGCFIELWSEKNFQGEYLRVDGPVELHALHLGSLAWGGSISSLRVGPSAFVFAYGDRDFEGATISFG